MKNILIGILALISINTLAKCEDINIKYTIDCKEQGGYSVVAVEDSANGVGLYLFKDGKEVHKSFGFGEYINPIKFNKKEEKLVVEENRGTFLILVRGFNSDSINNQEDGLFFNKINTDSNRIVPVMLKFKSGDDSDFISVPTKSKISYENGRISFDKVRLEFDGSRFNER